MLVYIYVILPLKKNYDARHVDIHGLYLLHPIPITNFELVDQNNNMLTLDSLANHWSLLFFGFTHCAMVCPVTLSSLNLFYQMLEKNLSLKNMPQIIFITIDPEKDTTERLKKYLMQFNPHFIGARTTLENTQKIKQQFHVFSEKAHSDANKSDQFNHSTEIILVNPQAEIQAYFYYPHDPNQLAKDYRNILKKENKK